MTGKFVQLTANNGDKLFVNSQLITAIRGDKPKSVVISTIDGKNHYVSESIEEVYKKIKQLDVFLISNFDL